ncbi:MAG: ATP-dependent RecD-like DNA helicase [Planctomycetota bacterium]
MTLCGTIDRFTFRNPDSGWAVVRLKEEGSGRQVTIVGTLAQLAEGQRVRVTGSESTHERFGRQIEVESVESLAPSGLDGIKAYLSSGLVKGIGPATAEKIVGALGPDALRIIEEDPDQLRKIRGLGDRKIDDLVAAVRAQKEVQNVLVFLRTHGLGQALAARIVRRYGKDASALIEANPYRLADEVIGVGFRTADALAGKLGIAPESPERLQAALIHVLGLAAREGHCYLPEEDLVHRTSELIRQPAGAIARQIGPVADAGQVVRQFPPGPLLLQDDQRPIVYPKALHQAEAGCARALDELLRGPRVRLPVKAEPALSWFERVFGMQLPEGQREAVLKALTEPVSIITGGPGVGKTTIVRALCEILSRKQLRFLLAAPTGRAAKRLEEATGRAASTIHRLLEFVPGLQRFGRDHENKLEGDMLVVDEASMLDVQLAYHLLRAIPRSMSLVLVGDRNQLPPVGPGSVLADLIASGRVATTALTRIFRQQRGSDIVKVAHGILSGEVPESGGEGSDFYFVAARDPSHARELILELVTRRIPSRFGLDPIRDVQVLCPMYRGETGADRLNSDMQDLLNPEQIEVERGGRRYRVRDKVLQIRNDYDREVFNGDMGRITHIDRRGARLHVRFPEREQEYAFEDLDQLVPAYAISVHRSQGSEYPAVVMPLTTDHFLMLKRSLLYTAVTRGKRLVVLVGSKKALAMAVRNHDETNRFTGLAERLKDMIRGDGIRPQRPLPPPPGGA